MTATVAVTRVIEIDVKSSAAASKAIQDMAGKMNELEKHAKNSKDTLSGFFGGLGTTLKGLAGAWAVDKLREYTMAVNELSDQSKILQARMDQVTKNAASSGVAFSEIIRISIAQGRELDGVAKLYEKVARNADNLGVTQKGVSLITEGFAASLRLSGTTTQEANAAMLQFSQALASGKLQGDEFRSILENNSVFMYELAKAAGVTMGALREMSKDGKLDTDFLREAMLKLGTDGQNMLQRMMENADKLPKTFAQAFTGVKSAFVDLIGSLSEGAEKTEGIFTRIANKITKTFREMGREIRDEAIIQKAIAEEMGVKPGDKKQETDPAAQRSLDLLDRRAKVEKDLNRVIANRDEEVLKGLSTESSRFQQLTMFIAKYKGELKGVDLLLSEIANRDGAEVAGFRAPGKPTTTPGKPISTENDPLYKFKESLDLAKRESEDAALGLGNNAIRANEAILQSGLDAHIGKKAFDELAQSTRALAAELDALAAAKEWAKRNVDVDAFFNSVTQKSDERIIAKRDAELKRMTAYSEKESAFEWLQKESAALQELIDYYKILGDDATVLKLEKVGSALEKIYSKKQQKEIDELGKSSADMFEKMADSMINSVDKMADSLLDFVTGGKANIGDFVEYFIRQMAKVALVEQMDPLVKAGASGLKDVLRDFFTTPNANGNMFAPSGIVPFAKGGMVDKPTLFNFGGGGRGVAGEAGPEAIMPVKRGSDGVLGVGAAPVNINIINQAGAKVTTEETQNANGSREIRVMIDQAVETGIGSGRFDSVLGHSFGVRRRGR